MGNIQFLDSDGRFTVKQPENYSYLYFPVAGIKGIKSSLTPNLGGDIKINQNAFLMEPVSAENLHNNRSGRNFWCHVENLGAWSVVGASAEEESRRFSRQQDESRLEAGFMWQSVERRSKKYQIEAKVTSFVPLLHNVEIMHVEIKNVDRMAQKVTPIAAIPIYARSADNIRDHRHVTSLLHRIRTLDYGVSVKPTLSFDERGHQKNNLTYFVCGITGNGEKPVDFYPFADVFIGEGGTFTHPLKVLKNGKGVPAGVFLEGKEAFGGIRFPAIFLRPDESRDYIIIMGITDQETEIGDIISAYSSTEKVGKALAEMKSCWQEKVNVRYDTGNSQFDGFMRWVSFQPILRRLYGCSFLPHHDYGRGGRGWRDLWQDCLSLLIMDPDGVRQMIIDNYAGVRADGTNATIIGEKQGEFIADRNGISRVWIDHGVWPFITTILYIGQTGDIGILKEDVAYFKDGQAGRGRSLDPEWNTDYGVWQKCADGSIYRGSIMEHILLQNLCAFYEVGAHNHIRLMGADWNDALDMAAENGESVAFTCAYAGNFTRIAELLASLETQYGWEQIELMEEMQVLLADDVQMYNNVSAKKEILQNYMDLCRHHTSGRKIQADVHALAQNFKNKAEWMKGHIRKTEWIDGADGGGWFNSYYDNDGQPVEGYFGDKVKMMLTGQVFAIMGGTAEKEQVEKICKSADQYLYDRKIGGYRINTDFKELKFNLGRMFGFAYGEKENGAVFSHMAVMYAYALYHRGFAKQGYKALQSLADTALDFQTSKIYPGIPEYFSKEGRGMYHYLTGAASWYMLTFVTEVFGVRGEFGNMVIQPKLLAKQFDHAGNAILWLQFAGKRFRISYQNSEKLDYGTYIIKGVTCDGNAMSDFGMLSVTIERKLIEKMQDKEHQIEIRLGSKDCQNCLLETM